MMVLMRHGQASFDAAQYDCLSPLGVEQSRVTGRFLRARAAVCDEVCIGPRERHRSTALELLEAWGVAASQRQEVALDEFTGNAGHIAMTRPADDQVGAVGREARLQQLIGRIGAWADGDLVLEGGPTFPEFRGRVGRWMRRELAACEHAITTCAVTSGGVIAAAICEVMDLPDSMFLAVVSQVRNASLTEVSVSLGRAVLTSFNSTAHLPPHLLSTI